MSYYEVIICIIKILDNTFFGTLFAGALLAWVGFYLYDKQKVTDIKYEDLRKIRESASLLLANIEIASKKYEEHLGMYNGKNTQLNNIFNLLNSKYDNHFRNEFTTEFNSMTAKIRDLSENLIALLKIRGNHETDVSVISEKTSTFNFYLLSVSVLYLSKPDDIEQYQKGVNEVLQPIRLTLQNLIKLK